MITSTEPFPSGTEIRINFSYPVDKEANVTIYFVFANYLGPCTEEAVQGFENTGRTSDSSARTLLLTGLHEGSQYSLVMTATLESGEITVSSSILESTLPTCEANNRARIK